MNTNDSSNANETQDQSELQKLFANGYSDGDASHARKRSHGEGDDNAAELLNERKAKNRQSAQKARFRKIELETTLNEQIVKLSKENKVLIGANERIATEIIAFRRQNLRIRQELLILPSLPLF